MIKTLRMRKILKDAGFYVYMNEKGLYVSLNRPFSMSEVSKVLDDSQIDRLVEEATQFIIENPLEKE